MAPHTTATDNLHNEIMDKNKPVHNINDCYEALLDLKSIFPSWSDAQDNFHFHWKEVLNSTTSDRETERKIIGFYHSTLTRLVGSSGEGLDAQLALDLISQLDERRKEQDATFQEYNLEEILSKDTSAIKPRPRVKKPPAPRRPAAEVTAEVLPDAGHAYGTRTRSRKMQAQEEGAEEGSKLEYGTSGLGTHLKKGFFSDYVWDFLVPTGEGNEYDEEIDNREADDQADEDATPSRAKRSRK